MSQDLPFSGLRILDISQGIAGPYCTQILWQQGAHVVKVEPPEGDWGRNVGVVREGHSALSISYNAGKQGLCLDARTPAGKDLLRRLALQADVVVQNFRPGVAERLGVGYANLAEQKPDLVYVSISGYGADGPYAQAPASDSVMQADTGLMFANQDVDRQPRRIGMLLADISTALYAAQQLAAALYRRLKTGRGTHLEISLFEACAALQINNMAACSLAGGPPSAAVSAPNGVFATADGQLSVLVLNDAQFARLCRALDRPDWLDDARFRNNKARMAARDFLHSEIAIQMAQAPSVVWEKRLQEHDVLHAPVRDYASVAAHPQTTHLGMLQSLQQPRIGELQLPGIPGAAGRRRMLAAPDIGEHTKQILQEAGLDFAEIAALLDTGVVKQFDGTSSGVSA
ncbi:LysR family transcriptional regulator [Pollutimonas nitritireducens]|uniref:LysR family transcriptional regulator n=1 Tax=Pollutimonas nitritireducens TaxID=2045209 RepID=A0A2N4UAT4_9BURK|nr:CoA transferase [Pollutimonas nitritireducens]PLC52108.1 LysR family transcriptional regulator [Pollutimonas nitritireducens]